MKNTNAVVDSAHMPSSPQELAPQGAARQSVPLSLAILNAMSDEIAVLSQDGVVLAVNDAWRRFTAENGFEPGQSTPSADIDANYLAVCQPVMGVGSDRVMEAQSGIWAVLDGRLPNFSLAYSIHSPGVQRWFRLSVTPWGELAQAGVVIMHTNITRRMQSAQELSNVLAALDQHAIVATTDVQGRISAVNDKLCDISGYSRAELLGQNHRLLNSGLHPKAFFEHLYQTIRAGRVWHGEVCNRAKEGHFYWMQTAVVPFMGDDGRPDKYVAIRSDITQRKMAEVELQLHRDHLKDLVYQKTADLRQSVEQNKRALSDLRQQKFVLDEHALVTMTDVAGRITYANDKFIAISGYSRDEVMGQDHQFLDSGHHPKGLFKTMYDTIVCGGVWHAEVCNRAKDGHLYWVDMTAAAFMGDDGKPREYICVSTDISNRKRAEEAAQAANRAKSEFLANMSHELRTPMTGVVGMVDILQQTELKPEQQRMLETIHKSSLSLLTILNDILDLSKIEAGKMTLENLPTHFREVAEDVAQLLGPNLSARSIDLLVFVAPELPHWIVCDPTRLRQVLLNLLGNAVKFSSQRPEGLARVVLSVAPFLLASGKPGVRLSVSDNGIGMSPQVLENLYQPFTQADESTARKFGGTGLGLSITQRLVNLMGGQISVQSTPGEGTEFSVELPLQASPPGRMLVFAPRLDEVHVLLVTQDATVVQIVQAYCQSAGAQVSVLPDLASVRQQSKPLQPAAGPAVAVLGIEISGNTHALDLPTGLGIVRLVQGRSDASGHDIAVSIRPLLCWDLIQGVAVASKRLIAPENADVIAQFERRRPPPRTKAPSVEEARRTGRLLLLAEDNETNREVILEQLRLLGYAAEVAENGAIALAMWRAGHYAVLLTDCHMPQMDGFELTDAIRRSEPPGTRLPILAITANALQGEAQRCRERGMDDYLCKPLRLKELGPMLLKWMPQPQETPPALPIWDATTLEKLIGDNPAMHRRLFEKFLINARRQVQAMVAAVAAGECQSVEAVAHTLKSAARSVGALALGELCQVMEKAGHENDALACTALLANLSSSFSEAETRIQTHVASLPAG